MPKSVPDSIKEMTGPIFTAASFGALQYPLPFVGVPGVQGQVARPNDKVEIKLSDNTQPTVFDSVDTALKCMEYMRLRAQWLLTPTDDIMIVSVSSTKLIIAETSLVNQKLLSTFMPMYIGGATRFAHRSMSILQRLPEAISDVGFCVQDTFTDNWTLQNPVLGKAPNLVLVDINYRASPTADAPGSKLDDGNSLLIYNYTPPAP